MTNSKSLVTRRAVAIGLPISGLLLWLSQSENEVARRRAAINDGIRSGDIGRIPAPAQQRLEAQVAWIAKHARVRCAVHVNADLVPGCLSVVVTRPGFEALTRCGAGNAVYDRALDAIFIDESLLLPYDFTVLGDEGVFSMTDVNSLGFVSSYLNFILAHELGHRHARQKSAGFFDFAVRGDRKQDFADEQVADRFAVETICKGYQSGDVPPVLRKLNALDRLGISPDSLSSAEQAAGDLMGAMLTMPAALLFSSSPYSPYYFDDRHPDFLRRAEDAIQNTTVATAGKMITARSPLIRAELNRMRSLSRWNHRELMFPCAVYDLTVRGGDLWAGCYELPRPDQLTESAAKSLAITERLLRISVDSLTTSRSTELPALVFHPAASGFAPEGSLPGAWLHEQFSVGRRDLGLPPPAVVTRPMRAKLFRKSKRYVGAFDFAEYMWHWPDGKGGTVGVLESELTAAATKAWGESAIIIGMPQQCGDAIAIPVAVSTGPRGSAFRLLVLERHPAGGVHAETLYILERAGTATGSSYEFVAVEQSSFLNGRQILPERTFDVTPTVGRVLIDGARSWRNAWWLPVQHVEHGYEWVFQRVDASGVSSVHQGAEFLNQLPKGGAHDVSSQKGDRPSVNVLLVDGGPLIIGFDGDSVFVLDAARDRCRVVFHPALPRLRMLDIGSGRVMFWIRNGQKAYVVDVRSEESK